MLSFACKATKTCFSILSLNLTSLIPLIKRSAMPSG